MKRYLSTKNTLTVTLLWSLVLLMAILLVVGFKKEHLSLLPITLLSLIIVNIIWILLDTRYVIKNTFLLYRSGPFRGRIDITKIQKIQHYSGFNIPVTMKPALDYKGFIITNSDFKDIYVSPNKSDFFIQELLKVNPKIEVI